MAQILPKHDFPEYNKHSDDIHQRSILIVEDYPANQRLLRSHLERAGYTVHMADSGLSAVSETKKNHFDLILMDLRMPKMDGYTATREIRSLGLPWSTIPILAMTGDGNTTTRIKCQDAGMNAMITKPISRESLLQEVDSWIRQIEKQPPVQKALQDENLEPNDLPINYSLTVEEFGDNEQLTQDVIKEFIETVEDQLITFKQALCNGDTKAISMEAHKIVGGAANLNADALATLARLLEKCASLDNADGNIQDLITGLEAEYYRLKAYLEEELHLL